MRDRAASGPHRLLMTADAVGGVWTYALDLARALGDSGMDIVLAVLGPSPSRAQRLELLPLRHVSVFEHGGRLEWMDDPWRDVAAASDWLLDLHSMHEPGAALPRLFLPGVLERRQVPGQERAAGVDLARDQRVAREDHA